jgi:DNA polymerase III subunit alpha, Gram-positive type
MHHSVIESLNIQQIVVSKNQKKMIVFCDFPDFIDFDTYTSATQSFKASYDGDIELVNQNKTTHYHLKDIASYIHFYFVKYHGVKPFVTLDHLKVNLLVDDSMQLGELESGCISCELFLRQCGFDVEVNVDCSKFNHISDDVVLNKTQKAQPTPAIEKMPYKRVKKEEKITLIKDIHEGLNEVWIEGELISLESRFFASSNQTLITCLVSDYEDAIYTKLFLKENESLQVKPLQWVQIKGKVVVDRFKNEIMVMIDTIDIIDKPSLMDHHEHKRIELQTHTKMSEMDGVSEVSTLIQRAFECKHTALAITDHNSVQSFPKAEAKAKALRKSTGQSLKLLYGVELNMVESSPNIVINPRDVALDSATYVIFDLETTGLSAQFDEIIEIGAIKVHQHQVIDSFHSLVKPNGLINDFIQSKTNITQSMVNDAPNIKEVLPNFINFLQGCIGVAHNASFDVGFIKTKSKELNIVFPDVSFIDTLELSRVLLSQRKSFRLGKVARYFNIAYDEEVAHRADYDVKVTHQVFQNLLQLCKKQDVYTLSQLSTFDSEDSFKVRPKSHVNVFAKNQEGLKALYELVSLAHTDRLAFFKKSAAKKENDEFLAEPRILKSDITERRKHLLIGASCVNNELFDIAANQSAEALKDAMSFYDFVEIQPLDHYTHLIVSHNIPNVDRLKIILRKMIDTAKLCGKIIAASNDVHYVYPHEKVYRDILVSSMGIGGVRHPLYLYDAQERSSYQTPAQHYKTTQEMLDDFSWCGPELAYDLVVKNTHLIANLIDEVTIIPPKLFTPKIENADENLKSLITSRCHQLYGPTPSSFITSRMEKEYEAITSNGFGVIYYIAHLLVKKSLDDGYMVGSRGSVGSSFVAFLANITEVNPLPAHYRCEHCYHVEFVEEVGSGFDLENKTCTCGHAYVVDGQDIPFETFLGFEGDKVPDIDLNFSNFYQEHAHAYTKTLFGEKNVIRAGTIGTLANKTAFGYAKGYGEDHHFPLDTKDAKYSWLASGVEGVKRTTGQHPGGIIVIPDENSVYEFTPIQFPANNPDSSWKTTHFEFADIHDNLLKLDILGHLDPSAMKLLEEVSGIDPKNVPLNDPMVMSLFSSNHALKLDTRYPFDSTGAVGLPEFGTQFVREMLRVTQPRNFSDLVRISGLSHGTDVWLNNAKDLVLSGKTLKDVIGCRDDIMVTLIHQGLPPKISFDIMENVRKGKGLKKEWIDIMKSNGVDDWYIDSCQKIKYMFPKAHAVAYVLMAVRVAYYKLYHPLDYYISFLSLRANAFDIDAMIGGPQKILERLNHIQQRLTDNTQKASVTNKERELITSLEVALEMCLRGYRFSNIDINNSHATLFIKDPNDPQALIPPFVVLEGLGENVGKSIMEAREHAPFLSKEDLQSRTQLNYNHIKRLDDMRVLKGLQESNQASLF